MSVCELCGEETAGRYLCGRHTVQLAKRLERLPKLYEALAGFLAPAIHGGGERISSGHVACKLPVNEAALDLRHNGMVLVLEGWRADVQRARGWGEPAVSGTIEHRVMAAARWLGMTLEWIAAEYPGAGDLAREVREMEGAALSVVGAVPERGRRIGQCVAVDASGILCGATLYHRPGETPRCSWCRTSYPPDTWLMLKHHQPKESA